MFFFITSHYNFQDWAASVMKGQESITSVTFVLIHTVVDSLSDNDLKIGKPRRQKDFAFFIFGSCLKRE